MSTREEQIKPWGFISPFAKNSLQDREMCNLTITRKSTVSATMALYTNEQLREAERRAEERVRAEIGRDSERLDWLTSLKQYVLEHDSIGEWTVWKFTGPNEPAINMGDSVYSMRDAIDRARLFGPINTTELDTKHD